MTVASEADRTRISERLKSARARLRHSQAAMAPVLGLSVTQLKRLEVGANVPSGETLLKYRELGFSPTWILTGEGTMLADEGRDGCPVPPSRAEILFPELLALVTEAIQHAYADAEEDLCGADLGRLSAEKYNEIRASIPDREHWRGAVLMMAAQLRKEIAFMSNSTSRRKRPVS